MYPSNTSNVTSSTRSNQQQQGSIQHMKTSNATNLSYSLQNLNLIDGNNVVFVNNEGIPIIRKSESDSASSVESIEDSTPPDTPLNADIINSSGMTSSSSSIKKHKNRSETKQTSSTSKIINKIIVFEKVSF